MNTRQKKTPGVLGGMGPKATVDFMAKVISQTPASCDQDHIRMLVDHNPLVPNRHEAIAGDDAAVVSTLTDMAMGLERAGADFLLMVCNTAHAYRGNIEAVVEVPFVSIVDEVVYELERQWPGLKRIGVMAADGCVAAGLYQQALAKAGREAVIWTAGEQQRFMALLYRVKAGDSLVEISPQLEQLAHSLAARGAEVLIAACTEIPLVLASSTAPDGLPVPLLSSTDILVSSTIDYALGHRALPTR